MSDFHFSPFINMHVLINNGGEQFFHLKITNASMVEHNIESKR